MNRLTLLAAAAIMLAGCTPTTAYRTDSGEIWTTSYNITYESASDLSDSILAVLNEVDRSLSPFNPDSRISAINAGSSTETDSLLRRMIRVSTEVNGMSGGLFDPTVAPLVNLWGFGYRKARELPDSAAVADALGLVGISRCSLTGDTLIKGHPQMEFNFSAIAKGFACDLVGEMLRRNGVENFLVEIGGEIVAAGINSRGEQWHVQIDAPQPGNGHKRLTVIPLTDCALATSGNYRNYRQADSLTVWHTINPLTGYPAVTHTLSATVRASDCALADALATACMAMSADSALSMIAAVPGAACLLVVESADSMAVVTSPNF
ncbi:MAG: FAD:protein FMN transferase [Paramuribaculum sp.]|nr:FAD:protein FMN transferase [Paramuribaculum sp.]